MAWVTCLVNSNGYNSLEVDSNNRWNISDSAEHSARFVTLPVISAVYPTELILSLGRQFIDHDLHIISRNAAEQVKIHRSKRTVAHSNGNSLLQLVKFCLILGVPWDIL